MKKVNEIWPEWTEERLIGQGAFGEVYKIKREVQGNVFYAALKVIEVPRDQWEVREMMHSGMSRDEVQAYYEELVEDFLDEIRLMEKLKGTANIVSIEDFHVERHGREMGWTLYIRMELLMNLNQYIQVQGGELPLSEILRLGMDLCQALTYCKKLNIIHRDIKPGNVFRNKYGNFKLGDFGIARQLSATSSAYSQKGTNMYMAPEVYRGEKYRENVDVYSLGIMLYRLMNHGRFPFMRAYPARLTPFDGEQALQRRMQGERIPPIPNVDRELSRIVEKACAWNPQERYASAEEMGKALSRYQRGEAEQEEKSSEENEKTAVFSEKKKGLFRRRKAAAAAAVILLLVTAFSLSGDTGGSHSPSGYQLDPPKILEEDLVPMDELLNEELLESLPLGVSLDEMYVWLEEKGYEHRRNSYGGIEVTGNEDSIWEIYVNSDDSGHTLSVSESVEFQLKEDAEVDSYELLYSLVSYFHDRFRLSGYYEEFDENGASYTFYSDEALYTVIYSASENYEYFTVSKEVPLDVKTELIDIGGSLWENCPIDTVENTLAWMEEMGYEYEIPYEEEEPEEISFQIPGMEEAGRETYANVYYINGRGTINLSIQAGNTKEVYEECVRQMEEMLGEKGETTGSPSVGEMWSIDLVDRSILIDYTNSYKVVSIRCGWWQEEE